MRSISPETPSQLSENALLDSVDPKELVHAVRRRKWWILASALVVGAAVTGGTLRQAKVYQAEARLVIEPAMPKVLEADASIDDLGERTRAELAFYNTQYQIMKSRDVVRAAISHLQLDSDIGFLQSHELQGRSGEASIKAIEGVLGDIVTVTPAVQSRVVRVIVEDFDPDRAAKIANAMAQTYIDHTLERRLDTTRTASKWLDQRVEEFARKLEDAERALHEFKRSNTLVSVSLEDRQNMTTAALTALNEKQIETRTKLIDLEAQRQVIQTQLDDPNGDLEMLPQVTRNTVVNELKTTIAELGKQLALLDERYLGKHPTMHSKQQQIEDAKQRLRREIQLIIGALDNEIQGLKSTEVGLAAAMAKEKGEAIELNNLALEYSKLSREMGTTEKMYHSLLTRQTQADLGVQLKSNFVHWLETAEPHAIPIRPSIPKNAAVGLFLGLLLGILLAVGSELLDNTVHTQADIEERVGLPFLGIVPSIRPTNPDSSNKQLSPGRDLYIVQNPKSAVAECARAVRTNLLFLSTDRPLKRLLLTSAGPSEGKSTTVIQLGIVMAQAGNRVLVVDTDLRRPRLHRTFGVAAEQGLTSVLLGTATLEQSIRSTEVIGLDLLPCGPLPPNPAEILHTERFANLLKELESRYDRLLLDSPPVNAVTDAAILSQSVDGTIIVVQSSKTAKEAVRRAGRNLANVQANVLGVVLNDVDFEEGRYGYHHYYYYQRYGYGYGSDAEHGAES